MIQRKYAQFLKFAVLATATKSINHTIYFLRRITEDGVDEGLTNTPFYKELKEDKSPEKSNSCDKSD
jgi:hypothetical protein